MSFLRDIKTPLTIVLIFAATWLIFNLSINGHYHKLYNGEIVYHCHPFQHNESNNSPFEDHHHTKVQYLILSQISNPVALLSIFLVLLGLILHSYKEIRISRDLKLTLKKYFNTGNYRAPPVFK